MASTLNASTSGVGGVITTADNSGILNIQTAGTTAITVNASQNVGVGVTPSGWGSSYKVLQSNAGSLTSYGQTNLGLFQNAYDSSNAGAFKYITTEYASFYQQYQGQHQWFNAPSGTAGNAITFTQAMTLNASGNLLLGQTTSGGYRLELTNSGATPVYVNRATNTGSLIDFANGAGILGNISTNSFSIAYNTTSDYRLKENVQPLTGALTRIAALKPCTYTWKLALNETSEGFIAHELAEVVPDCVTGEKDATREEEYEVSPAIPAVLDEEGNEVTPAVEAVMGTRTVPVYQSIDTSFLVATLTAAIQEQQALIINLTSRLEALEGVK
jgi:hypothetical protein